MPIAAADIWEWKPEYTVYDAEIDRERQRLFGLVNHLHEEMMAGRGAKTLGGILAEVTKFSSISFAKQEALMAAVHYPEIRSHVEQHDQMRRRITEFEARVERGEAAGTIEFTLMISEWIRNHVMVTDRRLGDYVRVEQVFKSYLDRLLNGDHRGCRVIVQGLLAEGISFRDLYVNLFQRTMYHMGELWKANQISVATEHLAASITLNMTALVQPTLLNSPRNGKKVVVTCVAGELHSLGAQMISDTFEFLGWDSFLLGANTPVEGLLELVEEKHPEVLCLSMTLSSHMGRFKETVKKAHARFPGLDILAGGQAFLEETAEVNGDPHLRYLQSLDELEAWIAIR
jgi:hemerythrin-like metal-binding protein